MHLMIKMLHASSYAIFCTICRLYPNVPALARVVQANVVLSGYQVPSGVSVHVFFCLSRPCASVKFYKYSSFFIVK